MGRRKGAGAQDGRERGIPVPLTVTALAVFSALALCEIARVFIPPGWISWQAHVFTAVLSATGALVAVHFLARQFTALRRRTERETRGREAAEREAVGSSDLLEPFFVQSLDGFFVVSFDRPLEWRESAGELVTLDYAFDHGRVTEANDAAAQQYASSRERFLGLTPNDLFAFDLTRGKDTARRLFNEGRIFFRERLYRLSGEPFSAEAEYLCLYDPAGRIRGFFGIQRETAEVPQTRRGTGSPLFHDALTGLFSRAYADIELRRIDASRTLPVSVIALEVQHLGLINDVFGAGERDLLLSSTASAVRSVCRGGDISARWDERTFIVVLGDSGDDEARAFIERVAVRCRSLRNVAVHPGIVAGFTVKRDRGVTLIDALEAARALMERDRLRELTAGGGGFLASLLERVAAKGHDTGAHLERLGALAGALASRLGLPEEGRRELELVVRMHDAGKAVLPEALLRKPGPLSSAEWRAVRRYPEAGFRIARFFPATAPAAEAVLSHREHWDGSGYPRGLSGRQIPLAARVFAVVEAYDVLTHGRPYGAALPGPQAAAALKQEAGKRFEPEILEEFLKTAAPA